MADIGLIIGITGLALLLLALALNLFGMMEQSLLPFILMNVFAWLFLAYYSYTLNLWIFTIVSLGVALSSAVGLPKVKSLMRD